PAVALDFRSRAEWIQGLLQLRVEVARSQFRAIHRRENLNVTERIEPEPRRDAFANHRDDAVEDGGGVVRLDKVEITLPGRRGLGQLALIDLMGRPHD